MFWQRGKQQIADQPGETIQHAPALATHGEFDRPGSVASAGDFDDTRAPTMLAIATHVATLPTTAPAELAARDDSALAHAIAALAVAPESALETGDPVEQYEVTVTYESRPASDATSQAAELARLEPDTSHDAPASGIGGIEANERVRGTAPRYFMDSPTESERLEIKTNPATVERHLRQTGLQPHEPATDIGCGSGAITRIMARIAGPAQVTGIDMSADRLAHAAKRSREEGLDVRFTQASVDTLPLANASSSYTHARMLFQYLADPERVLAEMVRVTRPGGHVVVVDLDSQITGLYPMEAWLHTELDEALRVLRVNNFDPEVGRKLYAWCSRAGLTDIQVWVEPYQVYAGGQLAANDQRNWDEKLATATAFLARTTGDTARWERFRAGYLAALAAPDAFYSTNLVIVRGTVASPTP